MERDHRWIKIIGDIDEKAFRIFSRKLDDVESCESLYENDKVIRLALTSYGGNSEIALAFFSRMRISPFKFDITVHGACMSAAVMILAAGDVRRMAKEAWVMVHDGTDLLHHKNARVSDAEKGIEKARMLEDKWNELLASRTTTDAESWAELHNDETYLTAEECKALGLIEDII